MFFNFNIERIIKKNILISDIIGCVFKINNINNLKFCSNISTGARI
jgi:hypothetical protein